jgi:hypothetical protein
MGYSIRCPVCRQKFPWNPVSGFPEFCPNVSCESRIAHDRDDDDIVMPFFKSAGTKANDDLYRQMEAGSEQRAQMAAAQAGVPVSEMADLKITNLNSTRHEGDIAAPPVVNPVTRQMDAIRAINPNAAVGFGGGAEAGMYFSGAVSQGHSPNAGARAQSAIRQLHADRMGHDKVGDIPALETQQPGYRRRV